MVSKNKLHEELNSFNKQLDKHLQGVGIDILGDISISSNSLPSDQYEQLLLLTQSLKDIRVEMNLMRKHMASDTEVMLKSLMNAQQKQFQEEMRELQEKTFSILKVFDPSQLREISSEIGRISSDQRNIKQQITSMKSQIDSLASSTKNTSDLDLKILLDPFFTSISSKQEKLESQIEHIFSREKNTFENFEVLLRDYLDDIQKSTKLKQKEQQSIISHQQKEISNIFKKVEKLDTLSGDFREKLFKMDSNLDSTKKELLLSSAKSEDSVEKKISLFEDKLFSSEERQQKKVDERILSLNDELQSIQKRINTPISKSKIDLMSVSSRQKDSNINSQQETIIDVTSLDTNSPLHEKKTQEKLLDIDARIKKLSSLR